jgi:transaldolase
LNKILITLNQSNTNKNEYVFMSSKLEKLKSMTTVVADTGDIEAIKLWTPQDATTNPSLLLKAAGLDQYRPLLDASIQYAKGASSTNEDIPAEACDYLAVAIGKEILNVIPGRISTEVDARLSFDTEKTVNKAIKLIKLYENHGVNKNRVLIKIASTWEGIQAAEVLEKQGINCNLTLLFSFAQAKAAAEAGAYLISPFVGRILDWHKSNTGKTDYLPLEDPGVLSVSKIYNYYKSAGYNTVVMGASFRNIGEIEELAGCDRLTISPDLLKSLAEDSGDLTQKLISNQQQIEKPSRLTEEQFRWEHNQDAMATEKLAEGIRKFAVDQNALEAILKEH